MPGVQIIQLPIITTPNGTESVPVETQGGVTSQVLLKNLVPVVAGSILDAILAAGLNSDVNPVGFSLGVSILKLTTPANAAFSVDGIAAPAGAKFLYVVNANTAIGGSLTIVDASVSASLAANRILTQAGAGLTLLYNAGILLWYDPEQARWRIMA